MPIQTGSIGNRRATVRGKSDLHNVKSFYLQMPPVASARGDSVADEALNASTLSRRRPVNRGFRLQRTPRPK
jgi:hypothetical protein